MAKNAQRAKRSNRVNPRTERVIPIDSGDTFVRRKKITLVPKNKNQENYIEALQDHNVRLVVAAGPAGTGKSMLAAVSAIKELENGNIDKIIITRPNVAVDDRDIGFLPGDIIEKMAPWMKPILDYFKESYSLPEIKRMIEDERIEICPIAFMRGRTFKNAWVIIDEAQGTQSADTMKAILTRMGENSKMIVTGDINQSDFHGTNGLQDLLKRLHNTKTSTAIKVCQFAHRDIERDPIVREVLALYGEK